MKVLTVREPWLWAILHGGKNIENRGEGALRWKPQRIGLHGAQRYSWRGHTDERVTAAYKQAHGTLPAAPEKCGGYLCHKHFAMRLIVATVDIVDIHPDTGCCRPWGESSYVGDRALVSSVAHLVLEHLEPLDVVIPAAGRLGLWNSPDLDEELADA